MLSPSSAAIPEKLKQQHEEAKARAKRLAETDLSICYLMSRAAESPNFIAQVLFGENTTSLQDIVDASSNKGTKIKTAWGCLLSSPAIEAQLIAAEQKAEADTLNKAERADRLDKEESLRVYLTKEQKHTTFDNISPEKKLSVAVLKQFRASTPVSWEQDWATNFNRMTYPQMYNETNHVKRQHKSNYRYKPY